MGSNYFHKSKNKGDDFETIYKDLTQGGKKGNVSYGTLTTIAESPLKAGLLYTGSDDGLVHVSHDEGVTWENINNSGIPTGMWVSSITPSTHKESRVYLSLNGYRNDRFEALVFVSENHGATWKQLGTDLPLEPVYVIVEDPTDEKIVYIGTDHGVYVSFDRGIGFSPFSNGLPAVPVHDLVVHPRDHQLVVGTHGRSIFVTDLKPIYAFAEMKKGTALEIFPMGEIKYSSGWGNGDQWSVSEDPELTISCYSDRDGMANLQVLDNEDVQYETAVSLTKGLNFFKYDLSRNGEAANNGQKPAKNGKVYLMRGSFEVMLDRTGESTTFIFVVK